MKPNPIIGHCPCPVRGCDLQMTVKRVQARTDTANRQRKAGNLYADCPKHGRWGMDGKEAMQDYIAENSTKCEANDTSGNAPAALPEPPAPKPTPPAPAPLKSAQPSAQPAPTPQPPSAAKKGRDFFNW